MEKETSGACLLVALLVLIFFCFHLLHSLRTGCNIYLHVNMRRGGGQFASGPSYYIYYLLIACTNQQRQRKRTWNQTLQSTSTLSWSPFWIIIIFLFKMPKFVWEINFDIIVVQCLWIDIMQMDENNNSPPEKLQLVVNFLHFFERFFS